MSLETDQQQAVVYLARQSETDYQTLREEMAEKFELPLERLDALVTAQREEPLRLVEYPRINFEWTERMMLTEADLAAIDEQEYVIPGLIAEGHITVIVGRAGTGKTTIVFDLTRAMANQNYAVFYIHADTHQVEAKHFTQRARSCGVNYLVPDMMPGQSIHVALENFVAMANQGSDLKHVVIIFDTMKKLTNMIQKAGVALLMRKLRLLTGAGATVVLLGHVNKFRGPDGIDVFEGTGDIENDCDQLIYFVPHHDDEGVLVSSVCDPSEGRGKMRALIEPMSWRIHPDRSVTRQSEYTDVMTLEREASQEADDCEDIEAILEVMGQAANQSEIVKRCGNDHGISRRQVLKLLGRYDGRKWHSNPMSHHNAKGYVPASHVPG